MCQTSVPSWPSPEQPAAPLRGGPVRSSPATALASISLATGQQRGELLPSGAGLWKPGALDGVCFAAERPTHLNRDEAGQLHCDVGPSLAYPSGWSWWHWHGVRVAQNVIEAPETITVAAIHTAGPQARRIMLERYRAGEPVSGIAAYLRDSGAQLVDHDPAFGTLWQINADSAAPMLMVEVENLSPEPDGTYRHFLLRVDPELRPLHRGGFGRGSFRRRATPSPRPSASPGPNTHRR